MNGCIEIAGRKIGPGQPVYVIAELSANHQQDRARAIEIVHAAGKAGADAIKLQTYTPDTITIDCDNEHFRIGQGTIWEGRVLHDLYAEAFTPWEWQPELQAVANGLGLACFSSPFDSTAVDFLEKMQVPAYKIASFELVDLPLIRRVAATGRPMIISTGMATLAEIEEAVHVARRYGAKELALLKCTSAYPACPDEMKLRTIPDMAARFHVPVGLSDHTMAIVTPVAAVALGACIIEKHITLSRSISGPDSAFSLEPDEFKAMVDAIRTAEQSLGTADYSVSEREEKSRLFRRSLFVVRDVKKGEPFTPENVRSIRPSHGLHPRHYEEVLGKTATCDIQRGTPFSWEFVNRF